MLLINVICRVTLNAEACSPVAQETKVFRDDYEACLRKLCAALILLNQDWTTNRFLSDIQGRALQSPEQADRVECFAYESDCTF